jgi:hypothetical protein
VKYLEHMILLLETKAILNVDFIETWLILKEPQST